MGDKTKGCRCVCSATEQECFDRAVQELCDFSEATLCCTDVTYDREKGYSGYLLIGFGDDFDKGRLLDTRTMHELQRTYNLEMAALIDSVSTAKAAEELEAGTIPEECLECELLDECAQKGTPVPVGVVVDTLLEEIFGEPDADEEAASPKAKKESEEKANKAKKTDEEKLKEALDELVGLLKELRSR